MMEAMELSDERLIRETGDEARLANLVEPVIEDLGYRLVRVRLYDHNGLTLQIMAERSDGAMTISDCETLSRSLSPVLDVADPISGSFELEVSSPGMDRPLVRRSDFAVWLGHSAKVETSVLVDGRRRFSGILLKFEDDLLTLRLDDGSDVGLVLDDIMSVRLVITDSLIRGALKHG